jgi:glycosyltransferase involved in cell wall biosynthesis
MRSNSKIYYWCPFITHVATVKAVYNSVISLNKFSKNVFNGLIIDTFGEWKNSKYYNQNHKIFFGLNVNPLIKKIPSFGFFFSRIKFILIFVLAYIPLKNFIKEKKPDYLIIHLMTSLPLFLNLVNNFDTKIILRISGKPKLNFIRYFFWKFALKKVFKITFPTRETLNYFRSINLIDNKKLCLLSDPIISTNEIKASKKNETISDDMHGHKKYYLAIGRLTKQKNFFFLIKCFQELILKDNNICLIIIGDGEDLSYLKKYINKNKINNNIFLIGHKENVFKYLNNCEAFILSSLWEDPGFVLLEAMFCNAIVLSSDCESGPKEIISENRGILFKSNSKKDFINKFRFLENLEYSKKFELKVNAKKFTKNFSLLNHYKQLVKLLS